MPQEKIKTPITVLLELTQKCKYSLPNYKFSDGPIYYGNTFHCEVEVANVFAVGFGHTKKEAKQSAASNALEELAEQGSHNDGPQEIDLTSKPTENFIGALNELCDKLKFIRPIFSHVSIVEPQCRIFTCECKVFSMITEGRFSTKKRAKQLAAKHMLDKIQNMSPGSITDLQKLTVKDYKAREEYCRLASALKVNLESGKTEDITQMFRKLMEEQHVSYDDFKEQFQKRDLAGLNYICARLGVKYDMTMLQENPPMACAQFGGGKFTLMALGTTEESATRNLIDEIYIILDVYIGMSDIHD
ncbi:hypothetical protein Zmor_003370 [Zophobas morio]|uniref:DRBM domain-containing protein n=1 Tax=Zophobas morio TaxID=2755281 RepID=A0AA38HLB9_9CUCU|nr:hypothetical protein Zmor_003370 [Zophobas morio]